jgi:hypothetical protein
MTPPGPFPYAAPAEDGAAGFGSGPHRPDLRKQARDAAIVALVVTVCGLLLGLLWVWLAPRVPLISDGKAVYLQDSEGEQSIGIDGWFTLLGAGFGLLSALVVFWRYRKGGIPLVIGLAVGGVLASIVAWRFGLLLGPTSDIVAHAKQAGTNHVFDAPMKLRAKGALLAWPALAMGGHLALTAAFGPRDPEPPRPTGADIWGTQEPDQPAAPSAEQQPEPRPDGDDEK